MFAVSQFLSGGEQDGILTLQYFALRDPIFVFALYFKTESLPPILHVISKALL